MRTHVKLMTGLVVLALLGTVATSAMADQIVVMAGPSGSIFEGTMGVTGQNYQFHAWWYDSGGVAGNPYVIYGNSRYVVEWNIGPQLPVLLPGEWIQVDGAEIKMNVLAPTGPAPDVHVSHIADTGSIQVSDYNSAPLVADLGLFVDSASGAGWQTFDVTAATVQDDINNGRAWSSYRFYAVDESPPAANWAYRWRVPGSTWSSLTIDYTIMPEPATMALLGIGGLLTLVRRRRRA